MLRTAFAARNHLEDPVIHFYETFLAEYDPQRRVDRGVYYTPPQVISYIVRSVDSLLKTELNRPDGLADDDTLILDPATGTVLFQDCAMRTNGFGLMRPNALRMCLLMYGSMRLERIRCVRSG